MKVTNSERNHYKNVLSNIKTKDDLKNLIYNLYVNQKFDYRKITTILKLKFKNKINTTFTVKVLKEFDIKRCVDDNSCKSPNGPIHPFDNFYSASSTDGKSAKCKDCIAFYRSYKEADDIKKYHMDEFQKIQEYSKKEDYIVKLHTDFDYDFTTIHKMTRFNIETVIHIFKDRDIKKCNENENCKHPNGPILSFEDFYDGKDVTNKSGTCAYCDKFRVNYYNSDEERKNKMDQFYALINESDKNQFILELYYQHYTLKHLPALTLYPVEDIIRILKSFDVKRCSHGENCVNKDGPFQSHDQFRDNNREIDKKQKYCRSCFNHYYNENKEVFAERGKEFQRNNKDAIKKRAKEYNREPSKYNTYSGRLEVYHDVRRDPNDSELIQVKCYNHKCTEWFNPTNQQVRARIQAIDGKYSIGTEYNFYCSSECQDECPLYGKQVTEILNEIRMQRNDLNKNDFKRMQAEIRKFKIQMDGEPTFCEKCKQEYNVKDLFLHHKIPVSIDHILEADLDNLIWECKDCHDEAHSKEGCTFYDLQQSIAC